MADKKLKIELVVDDKGSAQVKQFGESAKRSASQASSSFSSFGQSAQSSIAGAVTKMAALTGGVYALAQATKSIISTTTSFGHAMSNVGAVAGASAKQLEQLEDAARSQAKVSVFSALQAAEAQYHLASAGMSVNEIIAAQRGVMDLAAATQADLGESARITASALSQFGMIAAESGTVANVFAAAISNSQANMMKLGASMPYVGAVAKAVGYSLESTTAALASLYNAGLDGSMAGTTLRGSLSGLLNPTKQEADAMRKLGVNAKDSAGNIRPLADIVDDLKKSGAGAAEMLAIFGDRAGPGMVALVALGGDALRQMEEKITGTDRASEMATEQINNLWGDVKMMGSQAEESAIAIGEELTPALRDLVTTMTEVISSSTKTGTGLAKMVNDAYFGLGDALSDSGEVISALNIIFDQTMQRMDQWTEQFRRNLLKIETSSGFVYEFGFSGANYQPKPYNVASGAVSAPKEDYSQIQDMFVANAKEKAAANVRMAKLIAELPVVTGGGTSDEDAKAYAKAISSLNDAIAELTMSSAKLAQYRTDREFERLGKIVGENNPKLQEWYRLQTAIVEASSRYSVTELDSMSRIPDLAIAKLRGEADANARAETMYQDMVDAKIKAEEDFQSAKTALMSDELRSAILNLNQQKQEYLDAKLNQYDVELWYQEAVAEAQTKYGRDAADGIKRAFENYVDSATDWASRLETVASNTFSQLEDMIVEFAQTGKFEWQSLANFAIQQIARIAAQQALAGLASGASSILAAIFGSGMSATGGAVAGTISTGVGTFVPLATGGVINNGIITAYADGGLPGPGNLMSPSFIRSVISGAGAAAMPVGNDGAAAIGRLPINQIINRPMYFGQRDGLGLAGEAGPEGIVPLVQSQGGFAAMALDANGHRTLVQMGRIDGKLGVLLPAPSAGPGSTAEGRLSPSAVRAYANGGIIGSQQHIPVAHRYATGGVTEGRYDNLVDAVVSGGGVGNPTGGGSGRLQSKQAQKNQMVINLTQNISTPDANSFRQSRRQILNGAAAELRRSMRGG